MRPPSCDRDPSECRISPGMSTSTCLAWSPVYDGNGKRLDKGDPNWHTSSASCGVCGKRRSETTRFGVITVREDTP